MPAENDQLPQLWQAEWCPHSRLVRQLLTEMQVDFVARQVEAYPEDRDQLRDATGHDTIPVVVFADGTVVGGEDEEIVAAIRERFPVPTEARRQHREQWAAHQP